MPKTISDFLPATAHPILRFALRFLLSLFLLGLFVAKSSAATRPTNFTFADRGKQSLSLDLYLPNSPPPATGYPLLISYHGGGWAIGNKHNDIFLKPLVDRGYAIASVDYRLSNEAKFPAQIEDAREAVHWLLHHAHKLHLDSHHFATTGISAGAHLALLVAFSETHQFVKNGSKPLPRHTIKAVVAFYPPTDLVSIVPKEKRGHRTNLVAQLLGAPISERLALAREGSPMTYVNSHSPPVFLVHGERDTIVPLAQSETLYRTLKSDGVDTTFVIYAGKKHVFRPSPATIEEIAKFLSRYLAP